LLGEEDANELMSEFPSVEADELVTKQFLRAEMAELRAEFGELRAEFGQLRGEFGLLRAEVADKMHRQTIAIVGLLVAATALIEGLTALV